MNKIEKFLSKLSVDERNKIKVVLGKIKALDFKTLDIKKLKGEVDLYRVRVGSIGIIFTIHNESVFFHTVERRSDNTY
jgi:mRNA-degrading endonuclease RelE of RelBE toxin-antitoxin system